MTEGKIFPLELQVFLRQTKLKLPKTNCKIVLLHAHTGFYIMCYQGKQR